MIGGNGQPNWAGAGARTARCVRAFGARAARRSYTGLISALRHARRVTPFTLRATVAGAAVVMLISPSGYAGDTFSAERGKLSQVISAPEMAALIGLNLCRAVSENRQNSCHSRTLLRGHTRYSQVNDQPNEPEFDYYEGATQYLDIDHTIYSSSGAARGASFLFVITETPYRGFDLGAEVLFQYSF